MISADTMIRIASRLESMSNDACLGHNDVRMTPQMADVLAKCIKDYVRHPERQTCHLVEDEDGYTACSECGCTALCMRDAVFCPSCGAKVIEKEEDDA